MRSSWRTWSEPGLEGGYGGDGVALRLRYGLGLRFQLAF